MTQVHIVQKLAPGGIEQLALSLAQSGDMRIFSLEGDAEALIHAWPRAASVTGRLEAFGKRPGLDAALPFRLAARLRAVAATSVVTHHVGPLIYGGMAARLAGMRSVAHVEHDAWHLSNRKRRAVVGSALRLLRPARIAVSRTVAEAARTRTGLRFTLVANGVDCGIYHPREKAEARKALGLPLDRTIIGAAGRLEHVKGFDRLVDAASHLPDDMLVVIWGDGSEAGALQQRIDRLGLRQRVLLAGRSDRLDQVYPALDVFCLPSRAEGLPLSIIEAQACGIPVVASDVGGGREGLCPATGRAIAFGDDETHLLAQALAARLTAPLEADPRAFVLSNLSLDKTRDAYKALETCHA